MEGQVYLCSWKQVGTRYRVWWKARPKVSAEADTFEEADESLYEAIMEATGDGENSHEYDPPAPGSGESAGGHHLVLISGETSSWMTTHEGIFEGGLCAECRHPLGPRTARPIALHDMQRGPRNGGSISLRLSAFDGPRLHFVSAEFRALLTPAEDARFTWRQLVGPPRARKPFLELVDAEVAVPLVKPAGAPPSGWWCEACGFETSPFTGHSGWKGPSWHVALSDLPSPLPDVFAVGTATDLSLCFTRDRWRASIELPGAKGCRSYDLGVLRDDEIDHAPVRDTRRHQQAVAKQMEADREAREAPRLCDLQIALGEYDTGWHAPAKSLTAAGKIVRAARAAGANLVVLPEACTTGLTSDASHVEPLDGPRVKALGEIADKTGKHVTAGVVLRELDGGTERMVNVILRFETHGEVAKYCRKQRLSAEGGPYLAVGDSPAIDEVYWVNLAYFVGAELRSPEPFRAVARFVDAMIVLANWPAAERAEWDALLRARAIENRCYVLGVNRTGRGGGVEYGGGSNAFDPYGEPAVVVKSGVLMVEVRQELVKAARSV